jgi:glycosyltransferase involved in cell wall biosynthesis
MNPLVSVIVPAYNAARFLPECLRSLQAQTCRSLEIICVDDGSVDGALRIMQEFSFSDGRFNIISGANAGYGAACNKGLQAARGKYVTIFESDDFCQPEFYAELIAIAEEQDCDVVKSDFIKFWAADKTEYKTIVPDAFYGQTFAPRDRINAYNFLEIQPSVWSALYKRDWMQRNDIRFLETPGAAFQDTSFSIKVMLLAERVRFVNQAYYFYRQHAGQSIKGTASAFAVIAEFAEIERRFPLSPALFAAKFHAYFWNYRRIGFADKLTFLHKFANEYRNKERGLIREHLFKKNETALLEQIIASPQTFHERYGERLDFNRCTGGKR